MLGTPTANVRIGVGAATASLVADDAGARSRYLTFDAYGFAELEIRYRVTLLR